MALQRLSRHAKLPSHVAAPAARLDRIRAGILHIGLGAFHRAHQAIYTEDAMARRGGDWGIIGVSLRSRDIVADLNAQDLRYSVTVRETAGESIRVVGAIVGALAASVDPHAVLAHLADPAIRIVSLTVTEKAYGLDAATGGLDRTHPAVRRDMQTLQAPDNVATDGATAPSSVIGYLVAGLARRRTAGHPPFTVLCCDNLPANGEIVRRLVLEMAREQDATLADWIAREAAFPSSMVDRIVPAATQQTRERAAILLGLEDRLALETESFIQWVIEDRFVSGRPDWAAAGALFVADIAPYEKMKLRLLNGAHTLIAYLGQLHGIDYVRDVMAVPAHAARVRAHIEAAAVTLDPVPGIVIGNYIEQLLARFANPLIAHRTAQIAMDGSQKMPQRIFAATLDALAAGQAIASFAYVTALWLAFLRRQSSIDDPRAAELLAAAQQSKTTTDKLLPFLAIPGLFPPALANNSRWRMAVVAAINAIEAELTLSNLN